MDNDGRERRMDAGDLYEKVSRMHYILYENGFTKAVKDQATALTAMKDDMSELKKQFELFVATREKTCPVAKADSVGRKDRLVVAGAVFSGLSSLAVLGTLLLRIGGVL